VASSQANRSVPDEFKKQVKLTKMTDMQGCRLQRKTAELKMQIQAATEGKRPPGTLGRGELVFILIQASCLQEFPLFLVIKII
jgi:hypothetical protein